MTKKDLYLKAHSDLSAFMLPLTQKHCSPCKHSRGSVGCCVGGPFLFAEIEKGLNRDILPLHNNNEYCSYLKKGEGCTLKHKSGVCLSYLCGAIHKTLTQEERDTYWSLREDLGLAMHNLEGDLS